ncbi:hypothetical protein BC938DRAFT_479416 [Jimgerdemannia flammicorona]|uniref:Uncharacterized protein n=1 Tax=Jimgerdemannia flammicorona TaxID=994334 RepID=A0A433QKW7_9FUNG|nr:hypothetical protein BC938DRAFT_479416 [Jimgerdemannia flammicorona]
MDYFLSDTVNWDPSKIIAHYAKIYPEHSLRWRALQKDLKLLSKSTSFSLPDCASLCMGWFEENWASAMHIRDCVSPGVALFGHSSFQQHIRDCVSPGVELLQALIHFDTNFWSRTVKSKLRKDDEFSKATLAARNVKDLDAGAEDEQESNILENGDSVHPYAGHNGKR